MYAYILKSTIDLSWSYVGSTAMIERRLRQHKKGTCSGTREHKESLYVFRSIVCKNRRDAYRLERYLKHNLELLHLTDLQLLSRSYCLPYTDWEYNLPV